MVVILRPWGSAGTPCGGEGALAERQPLGVRKQVDPFRVLAPMFAECLCGIGEHRRVPGSKMYFAFLIPLIVGSFAAQYWRKSSDPMRMLLAAATVVAFLIALIFIGFSKCGPCP